MTLWVVRGDVRDGVGGTFEDTFIDEELVGISCSFFVDLTEFGSRDALRDRVLHEKGTRRDPSYPAGLLWDFAYRMAEGDCVIVPLPHQQLVAVGEIAGPYAFAGEERELPIPHVRPVRWLGQAARRDLGSAIHSSIASGHVLFRCRARDAEKRVRALLRKNEATVEGRLQALSARVARLEEAARSTSQ